MATYAEQMWIADQSSSRSRVDFLMTKAAVAVMAEDASTDSHADRVVYAKKVLEGTASVPRYTVACVTNSTLVTNGDVAAPPLYGISDSDLEFTVNSLFNAMAGVATV